MTCTLSSYHGYFSPITHKNPSVDENQPSSAQRFPPSVGQGKLGLLGLRCPPLIFTVSCSDLYPTTPTKFDHRDPESNDNQQHVEDRLWFVYLDRDRLGIDTHGRVDNSKWREQVETGSRGSIANNSGTASAHWDAVISLYQLASCLWMALLVWFMAVT